MVVPADGGAADAPRAPAPEPWLVFFAAANGELIDNWDVGGLRGTGSHDYAVSGLFVPEARAIPFDAAPRALGPLYRLPRQALLDDKAASSRSFPRSARGLVRRAVRVRGSRLYVQATGEEEFEAFPKTETRFFSPDADAEITFVHDAAGKTNSLLVRHEDEPDWRAYRVPPNLRPTLRRGSLVPVTIKNRQHQSNSGCHQELRRGNPGAIARSNWIGLSTSSTILGRVVNYCNSTRNASPDFEDG